MRTAYRKLESGARLAMRGMLLNAALCAIKIAAGLIGGSYALIADGVESLLDVVSSLLLWGGLRYAARPPDASHPYGHGKAEPVAAIMGSVTILAAGIGLAVESVRTIYAPRPAPSVFTLPVLVLVVAAKEIHARRVLRLARETGSTAIAADAVHHRGDVLTSVAAFIGISLAILGGKNFVGADNWAALFACAIIGWNGLRIVRPAMLDLMDTAPPREVTEQVRIAACAVEGVFEIEKCRVRKMGLEYYVDLHVTVDAGLTVRSGHEIAHRVKDAVRNSVPDIVDVLVHIEPARDLEKSA